MRRWAQNALGFALIWLGTVAWAETHAVLVGVSDYVDDTGIPDLQGPPNDVRLLQRVLGDRGVSQIVTLADGVEGAMRPTRANILGALTDLAGRIERGDFVYVHFSGHGTRQADLDGDETDGLDEVFLPADTGFADAVTGQIAQAITDDEIGQAVDALRARGADVWLVIDSCHAGSGLRAATAGVADRYVDPSILGAPGLRGGEVEAPLTPTPLGPDAGGVIAFYAAQSSEVAREVDLSDGTGQAAWYGLFTSRLAARLDAGRDISFRQVFQGVLRDMNDLSVPGAARLQTPLWEGDLIDAAVFGGGETAGLRRFAVTGDTLEAGRVHGLVDGTLVGLVADVADPPEAVLGVAQLEATEATMAFLRPVSDNCTPATGAPCARDGTLPEAARFAQVLAQPVDLTVRLATPRDTDGLPLPVDHPARQALQAALAPPLTLSDTAFEVEVLWDGARLWFGPRASVGETPVGLSWAPGEGPLAPLLARIAKAETFARTIGSAAGTPSLLNPNPVTIEARLAPVPASALVSRDAGLSPVRECRAAQAAASQQQAETLPSRTDLKQCDGLSFAAQGRVPGARDINRIHIDAQFCIHASHARVEDTTAPRRLGPDMTLCSDCPGGYSAGEERLFVVVTEAQPNRAPLNLEGLVENCGPAPSGTRSAQGAQIAEFLTGLAQGRVTRGNMGAIGIANIWVEAYGWTILPKPKVFARHGLDR